MAKSHTRKKTRSKPKHAMGLKKLRTAFDHMDKFVNRLKATSKHSFADAVSEYRAEWHRVFKKDISPADAASYLKFRFGLKGKSAMTRRTKMRGGALGPLAGAPLDYMTRDTVGGPYGTFPALQQGGIEPPQIGLVQQCATCNAAAATQKGGSLEVLRPIASAPPNGLQTSDLSWKGINLPDGNPVSMGAMRAQPSAYIPGAGGASWASSYAGTGSNPTFAMYGRP
jgi:hypothetical protein